MSQWLLERLFEAKDQAEPRFAFQGTINWMRALSEVVNNGSFSDEELSKFYASTQRRTVNKIADTLVFENMHMAHHNLASLYTMYDDVEDKYDICRSAIVSWYYTTYFSASAMVAAASGSAQETHAATSKVWKVDIADKNLIPYPFNLCLNSLVSKTVEENIKEYRGSNVYDLNHYAESSEQAHGSIVSYLKGTASYKKWEVEERVKSSREFKELEVKNFRTKVARELRDKHLSRGQVNYLIQAFRYRGKANYRDTIFLSYGDNNKDIIEKFIKDLLDVSFYFIRSASFFCAKRVEIETWGLFVDDIEENTRLSIDTSSIKI
ncbi:MAG: hypothetical protein GXP14_17475 [Gammaproteobacteria bacterium]|nr:hypothetical protein [Gammaproteobacteria bacterium]